MLAFANVVRMEGGRTGRESERVGFTGATTVGIFMIQPLARGCVEGKGRHPGEGMDMRGDLWYFAVAVNPFVCFCLAA